MGSFAQPLDDGIGWLVPCYMLMCRELGELWKIHVPDGKILVTDLFDALTEEPGAATENEDQEKK